MNYETECTVNIDGMYNGKRTPESDYYARELKLAAKLATEITQYMTSQLTKNQNGMSESDIEALPCE